MSDGPPLFALKLPPAFRRWEVAIVPGQRRAYQPDEWRDAIIVVEQGHVELEYLDGSRLDLGPGAVLWLDRLPLRALHNSGPEPALLVAVARNNI